MDQELRLIAPSLMKMQQQNPCATDYRNILFQNIVTGCTMSINRPLAELAGRCTDPAQTVMHDWWLALVAAKFGKLIYVPEATVDYRQHGKNSVGAKDVRSMQYFFYKILHLKQFRQTVWEKKKQALAFENSYRITLSAEDCATLKSFGQERSPQKFKNQYLKWICTPQRQIGFLMRW